MPDIILASTSPFRKSLLEKLNLNFKTAKPEINETHLPDETVEEMVKRLSLEKAQAIAQHTENNIIIASDQSACFNKHAIGKPLTPEKAIEQLSSFSGNTITFYTGLVVIDQQKNRIYETMDKTKVCFRQLSEEDIKNYLAIEKPFQCAGSFKSEGLGITLFEKIESTDPNALIGLPLIELTTILKKVGLQIPPSL